MSRGRGRRRRGMRWVLAWLAVVAWLLLWAGAVWWALLLARMLVALVG